MGVHSFPLNWTLANGQLAIVTEQVGLVTLGKHLEVGIVTLERHLEVGIVTLGSPGKDWQSSCRKREVGESTSCKLLAAVPIH